MTEVPAAVLVTLRSLRPSFEPTEIEAVYQMAKPQPVSYGFEGRDPAGKKVEIYLSADGKTWLNEPVSDR